MKSYSNQYFFQGALLTTVSAKETLLLFRFSSNFFCFLKIWWSWYDIYLVTGTSNNGWEDSPGGVITSKSSFAHAGAIVNNQSGGIFVTHVGFSLKICLNLDRTKDWCQVCCALGHFTLYMTKFRQKANRLKTHDTK